MFNRKHYCVYHWQKAEREYAGLVVLAPFLTDGYAQVCRVFGENVYYDGKGESRPPYGMGIPRAELATTSSKGEIEKFLLGIGKSERWDFNSFCAIAFDATALFSREYDLMLRMIDSSIARRMWLRETLGID
jgi:hypothetical protein